MRDEQETTRAGPRRGRRPSDEDPARRQERLAVFLIKRDHPEITNRALALCRNVHPRTIMLWRKQAASYPELSGYPEAGASAE